MEYSNEDAYLLMALRRGEMIAFDSIFKKYYPILCAYGNRFVDYEESKEIAGDAILWLWEHRETLQVETSLGRYLLKSVYHRSLNCIKQKQLKNHGKAARHGFDVAFPVKLLHLAVHLVGRDLPVPRAFKKSERSYRCIACFL